MSANANVDGRSQHLRLDDVCTQHISDPVHITVSLRITNGGCNKTNMDTKRRSSAGNGKAIGYAGYMTRRARSRVSPHIIITKNRHLQAEHETP